MSLSGFANTQPLAVGVRLPTDCELVLPRWALRAQIMARRGVGERRACQLFTDGASELLPNPRRKPRPTTSSGVSLLYFPL